MGKIKKYENSKFTIRATARNNIIYLNADDLRIMLGLYDISLAKTNYILADTIENGEKQQGAFIAYDGYKEIYKDGMHPLKAEFDGWIKTIVIPNIRKSFEEEFYSKAETPIKAIVDKLEELEIRILELESIKEASQLENNLIKVNAEKIRTLIKRRKLTFAGVSRKLKKSSSYLNMCFQRGTMQGNDVIRLAELLNVDYKELITA